MEDSRPSQVAQRSKVPLADEARTTSSRGRRASRYSITSSLGLAIPPSIMLRAGRNRLQRLTQIELI
jgi:hypothetical protein